MTRRHVLEHHRRSLAEIRNIMNSMKALSYMETRKLARFLDAQQTVVRSIEYVAEDLISFYPEILPEEEETLQVYLVLGTERGFCGDFNHSLLKYLGAALREHPSSNVKLITIGLKLAALMEKDPRLASLIEGASVAEEVTSVLNRVISELTALQDTYGMLTVFCLYHGGEDGVVMQKLLPPFQHFLHKPPRFVQQPMLNLDPRDFLVRLSDHYLFAALHELLYTSLIVENRHRVTHLEGAIRRLDKDSVDLARQCNALRQEEIIEEIEVILLSAASLGEHPDERGYSRKN